MNDIIELLIPFVRISKSIIQEEAINSSETASKSEKRQSKKNIASLESKFQENAKPLIYQFITAFKGDGGTRSLPEFLNGIFGKLRQIVQEIDSENSELDIRAIDKTAKKLTSIATKQQAKSPVRRRLEHYGIFIFLALVLVVYFGIRWLSAIPTSTIVETREHLIDAASALEKIERYDDWMDA